MKISIINFSNRKKCFEIIANKKKWVFPYSKLCLKPTKDDAIKKVYADNDIGKEGFTYILHSGKEDTIHVDTILEYNKDPEYIRKKILYDLTIKANKILKKKKLANNEIIRRLKISQTQFYRLIDTSNYKKTIDMMVKLLSAVDCQIDIKFRNVA